MLLGYQRQELDKCLFWNWLRVRELLVVDVVVFFLRGLKDQQYFNVEGHPVAAGPCAPTTEPDLSQDGSGKHYNNTFTPNTVHLFDFVPVFLRSFGINSPS